MLTAFDVLIVLFLQNKGFRYIEALVAGLIGSDRDSALLYEIVASGPAS